jgi:hypothetical protein
MRELKVQRFTLREIAAQLNLEPEKYPTRSRGKWHAMAVQRILKRNS